MSDSSGVKRAMRADVNRQLEMTPPAEHARWSDAISRTLLDLDELTAAETVMAYIPIGGEPDVLPLLRTILVRGQRLCLPRVKWDDGSMEAVEVRSIDGDLVSCRYGLREPAGHLTPLAPAEVGFVLVPGVAFDEAGGRLGRGSGFYDRFLRRVRAGGSDATLCGVCFQMQLCAQTPLDPDDMMVDALVTERGYRVCSPLEPATESGPGSESE